MSGMDEVIKIDAAKFVANQGVQLFVRLVETQDTIDELNKLYDELLKSLEAESRGMFLEYQCMPMRDRRCMVELYEMAKEELTNLS